MAPAPVPDTPAPAPAPDTPLPAPAPVPAQDQNQNQNQDQDQGPIPAKCQILVIGGGPGGSYAAAALAREGLDVVLLEAEVFPRYHIGESMLASIRHLLRFIDLDATFDAYGFTKKVGAAFKLNGRKREGFTDFLAAGGPENYAWNVVRAEADELMFRHAGKCGARVFDGVKVASIAFAAPLGSGSGSGSGSEAAAASVSASESGEERPVSATWTRKRSSGQGAETGTQAESGSIAFDYLVDASGRAGLLSTRYLKTRTYNRGLRNVASWGYWRGAGAYARGTERANAPFFEALGDESGWAWLIPLHNGTASVGIVMNQDIATAKKKAASPAPSAREFYLEQLKLAPSLLAILHSGSGSGSDSSESASAFDSTHINGSPDGKKEKEEEKEKEEKEEEEEGESATLVSDIKSASDYSYSASTYSTAHARIVGDAGCFIDPYFSSGVHLALASALSAATTICAALRGDCTEREAARWHDAKVGTGYTRFLMVVLSAYKQIRSQQEPVLADFDEDNFDRAFALFRPIIQGTADVSDKLSQEELAKTLDFCAHAFEPTLPEDRASVLEKLNGASASAPASASASAASAFPSADHPSTANGHASTPNGASASASSNGHGHAHPVSDGTTDGTTNANGTTNGTAKPKPDTAAEFDANLSTEEQRVLKHIRARTMMRTEDTMNIASFSTDVVEGFAPRLECGVLGLRRVGA